MALWDWLRVRPQGRQLSLAFVLLLGLPLLLMGGEALLRARLDPLSSHDAPLRIYARPFSFSRGMRPNRAAVEAHLQRLGYREARGREMTLGEYYLGSRVWILGRRAFRGSGGEVEGGFAVLRFDSSGRIARMEDETGGRIYRFPLEPEFLGRIGQASARDRLPVPLEEVPKVLVQAVLTAEDQRFFEHAGLDYRRIGAAFLANLEAGRVVQGGAPSLSSWRRTST